MSECNKEKFRKSINTTTLSIDVIFACQSLSPDLGKLRSVCSACEGRKVLHCGCLATADGALEQHGPAGYNASPQKALLMPCCPNIFQHAFTMPRLQSNPMKHVENKCHGQFINDKIFDKECNVDV